MYGEAGVLQDRVEVLALMAKGAGATRVNGFDVARMNRRNATVTAPCTASVLARRRGGIPSRARATTAPNRVRMRIQRSIEPSWFPQTPVSL